MDIEMWNAVLSKNTWRFGCDITEVAISNDSKIKEINIFLQLLKLKMLDYIKSVIYFHVMHEK